MILNSAVNPLLQRAANKHVNGNVIDHEIIKHSGKVSRDRQYRVYLPSGYDSSKSYPLVMVLHGCKQDHQAIQAIAGFDAIADEQQFIVVYPFVTTYAGLRTENCWGWWLSHQRQRGQGEVADLVQIATDVSEQYAIDTARWHICGLSSGAAMSVASLAAYSDQWHSGASVAGVAYGESMRAVKFNELVPVRRKTVNTLVRMLNRELVAEPPPLLVIQSTADQLVGPKLGCDLKDAWVKASYCSSEPTMSYADKTNNVSWQFDQYQDAGGRTRTAYLLMDSVEHSWPGGLPGNYSTPNAPNVSQLMAAFFSQARY